MPPAVAAPVARGATRRCGADRTTSIAADGWATATMSDDHTAEIPLTVTHDVIDGRHRVRIEGELDAFTVPEVRAVLADAEGGDVVLDLDGVTFIDSSGLAMVVEARQRLQAQQRQLVIGPRSPIVQRLLELSGVAGHLDQSC